MLTFRWWVWWMRKNFKNSFTYLRSSLFLDGKQWEWIKDIIGFGKIKFNYRTRVRSLFTLVTDSLTNSCLANLIDVTLACEDTNTKLVDVVTVTDEDPVGNNLLQISKLRFGKKSWTFVHTFSTRFGQDFEFQARFEAGVRPVFFCWCFVKILKLSLSEELVKILKLKFYGEADVWLRFWSWCLVEILKKKFDQDLCLNLWYDPKKLLW